MGIDAGADPQSRGGAVSRNRNEHHRAKEEVSMCPFCLATAVWIAAAAVSTGGVTALAIGKVANGNAAKSISTNASSKEDHHG
jgi:hypothetical protein